MEAVASRTLMADHERKFTAACTPYFHMLDGAVELQSGHQSSSSSWQLGDERPKRNAGLATGGLWAHSARARKV